MKPAIKRFIQDKEFYIPEGCYITELSNSPEDPGVSIARARVEPGVTTRRHHLVDTAERYIIVEGEGRVEIESLPATNVGVGDVVLIPPMCRQRIANTGSGDLVFLAICSPRFVDTAYRDSQ